MPAADRRRAGGRAARAVGRGLSCRTILTHGRLGNLGRPTDRAGRRAGRRAVELMVGPRIVLPASVRPSIRPVAVAFIASRRPVRRRRRRRRHRGGGPCAAGPPGTLLAR